MSKPSIDGMPLQSFELISITTEKTLNLSSLAATSGIDVMIRRKSML